MNVMDEFERFERLVGEEAMERLAKARVAVFGVGGVGSYVVEALARSGVGALDLIDSDEVSVSNINRQLIALHSSVGQRKVDVAAARVRDINPGCTVRTFDMFFLPENADVLNFADYDYCVDAVDTVSAKLEIVQRAQAAGAGVICAMGTGNKLDPSKLVVTDIYRTEVCPLAKVMRHECRKRGIEKLKVVYSTEEPIKAGNRDEDGRRGVPGSSAFVPPAAGILIASEVVRDLLSVRPVMTKA